MTSASYRDASNRMYSKVCVRVQHFNIGQKSAVERFHATYTTDLAALSISGECDSRIKHMYVPLIQYKPVTNDIVLW